MNDASLIIAPIDSLISLFTSVPSPRIKLLYLFLLVGVMTLILMTILFQTISFVYARVTHEEYTATKGSAGVDEALAVLAPSIRRMWYLPLSVYGATDFLRYSGLPWKEQILGLCACALAVAVLSAFLARFNPHNLGTPTQMSAGGTVMWYMLLVASAFCFMMLFGSKDSGIGGPSGRREPFVGYFFPTFAGIAIRRLFLVNK